MIRNSVPLHVSRRAKQIQTLSFINFTRVSRSCEITLSLIITALLNRWADSWRRMRGDQRVHASAATGMGADQDLLRAHVWGVWARGDSLHHDSYTCHMFPGSTAWPTQRINTTDHNFFGAVGPVQFMQVCPVQCRRKGHEMDWIYC